MTTNPKKSEFTTISITKEALDALKEEDINFHGLSVKDNSSKIIALKRIYDETQS